MSQRTKVKLLWGVAVVVLLLLAASLVRTDVPDYRAVVVDKQTDVAEEVEVDELETRSVSAAATVVEVIDGAAVDVAIGGRRAGIRLRGIKAGKTARCNLRKPTCAQCKAELVAGRAARAFVCKTIPPGSKVQVVYDPDGSGHFRYGFMLIRVDGGWDFLENILFKAGLAVRKYGETDKRHWCSGR